VIHFYVSLLPSIKEYTTELRGRKRECKQNVQNGQQMQPSRLQRRRNPTIAQNLFSKMQPPRLRLLCGLSRHCDCNFYIAHLSDCCHVKLQISRNPVCGTFLSILNKFHSCWTQGGGGGRHGGGGGGGHGGGSEGHGGITSGVGAIGGGSHGSEGNAINVAVLPVLVMQPSL
jgi:hypothetical protein